MRLSLVIPAHNEENFIAPCLESVLAQNVQPDEIIVVDNNSTDFTAAIVQRYPVILLHETRKGQSFARNTGFDAAKGDIIARCDADTVLPADWTERVLSSFENPEVDALSGPTIYYDMPFKSPRPINLFMGTVKILQRGKETLYGPNMAIRRELWHQIRELVTCDDKRVHEDMDMAIHAHRVGGKVHRDKNLIAAVSARRIKGNPASFFIGYPIKFIRTYTLNAQVKNPKDVFRQITKRMHRLPHADFSDDELL